MEFSEAISAFQAEARELPQGADLSRLYPAAQNAIEAHNELFSGYEGELPPPYDFVNEVVRTAHMLTGLVYALDEQGADRLNFLEAGCGTGFFVAAALALDERVEAMGIDLDARAIACTQHFLTQLPALSHRVKGVEKKDLIKDPRLPFIPDVVIAEQICGDLRDEPIDKVQRVIARKPGTSFLPYAIRPYVTTGFEVFRNDDDNKDLGIQINSRTLQRIPGPRIVLSTNRDPFVTMEGRFTTPAQQSSLLGLGMDIQWFRGDRRRVDYTLQDNLNALRSRAPYDGTLAGPHPILTFDSAGKPSGLLALKNTAELALPAYLGLRIALGYNSEPDVGEKKKRSIELNVRSYNDAVKPLILDFSEEA